MTSRSILIKRTIVMVLALILVFGMASTSYATSIPFTDVSDTAWYRSAVEWAYANEMTSGTGENQFSPDQQLSYAEICTFLYRYAYSPKAHYYHNELAKYSKKYYYKSVNWCCDFGIVAVSEVSGNGRTPGSAKMTRNDYVYTMYRYAQKWEKQSVYVSGDRLSNYTDAPTNETYRKAWNWAVDRNLIYGTSNTTLSPNDIVTRSQFVTVLWRYDQHRKNGTAAPQLVSEQLIGKKLRGWQRTLIEAGEKCLGRVTWVDEVYELGSDGIPVRIDCSGFVNWMFTYTGIHPYNDMDCADLWASNTFTKQYQKYSSENGYTFMKRVRYSLQPGDMLLSKSQNGNHIMVFLANSANYVYVIQCRSGKGVVVEAIPFNSSSYYIKSLYGVLRYIP